MNPSSIRQIILATLLLTPSVSAANDPWIHPGYASRVPLSNIATVAASTHTDFPILVSLSNQPFLAGARADGGDLSFAGVDGKQFFSEIESFDRAAGNLTAWVCIPTLTNNARIYLYFSNVNANLVFDGSNSTTALIATFTNLRTAALRTNVWNAGYDAVYHFAEGAGLFQDSTRSGLHAVSVATNIHYQSNGVSGPGIWATGATGFPGVQFPGASGYLNRTNTTTFWFAQGTSTPYASGLTTYLMNYQDMVNLRLGNPFNSSRYVFKNYTSTPFSVANVGAWNWVASINAMADTNATPVNTPYSAAFLVNGAVVQQLTGSFSGTPAPTTGNTVFMGSYSGIGSAYAGTPVGWADEYRVSRVIRTTNWLLQEYSNQLWAKQGYGMGPVESAVAPQALSPLGGTLTTNSVTFSWAPGNYPSPLARHMVTVNAPGFSPLVIDAGSATTSLTNLAAIFGLFSTNTLSWWVTAELTDGSTNTSLTNSFSLALSPKARVKGTLQSQGGAPLASSLVQFSGATNGWLFTDAGGRFDLGPLTILNPLRLTLTPTGRYPQLPLGTNFDVPVADIDLTLTCTNRTVPMSPPASLSARTNTAVCIASQHETLHLRVPEQWGEPGLVSVTLTPLSGGIRTTVWSGLMGGANLNIEAPLRGLLSPGAQGVYLLEMRQATPGRDQSAERVLRQMLFLAR